MCQILNKPSKELPKTFKVWPKWRNFAKSGHTACKCVEIDSKRVRQKSSVSSRSKRRSERRSESQKCSKCRKDAPNRF